MLTEVTQTLEKWQDQGYQYLVQGNYNQAANFYEQAITSEANDKSNYWHLGLVLLLQGQQAEAQTTWLMVMMDSDDENQIAQLTEELRVVLTQEAARREAIKDDMTATIIRQQIKEICPKDIDNLLHLVQLSIKQETYTGDELIELGIIEILQSQIKIKLDWNLLITVLGEVLGSAPLHPSSLELATVCIAYIADQNQAHSFINTLVPAAVTIAYSLKQAGTAAIFLELGLRIDNKNRDILFYITSFYLMNGDYEKGIETASIAYNLAQELPDIVFANFLFLKGLVSSSGTNWQAACAIWQKHESLLAELIKEKSHSLTILQVSRIFNSNYFTPYLQDHPEAYRHIRTQLAQLCQLNVNNYYQKALEKYQQGHLQRQKILNPTRKLKIGYLSHCFKTHSVGWLARWLIKHHDHERFQINGYCIYNDPVFDPLHEWYLNQFNYTHKSENVQALANQIYKDEIDILIDLDSITLDLTCMLVALKAAPVQVTWLGSDASGIPTIDYFIADPYVLPDSAENYYSEKIWRLPQTYIAVDGFEVGVPNVSREDLNIPADAVTYYSGQRGFKRHPDTARLQMKIIHEVPNSYFLIKGDSQEESIKSFFYQLAEEEGVEIERLRFLPPAPSEATHRANLGIADIVLDTYPYNGATTTLETLWMCIPMVTRVGEQFAARNSYTMMMNAGITEGIAWSDEEYVEWGVRLGKDEALRQQIAWKLRQSRKTAPLWNGKQFTREMENAYTQMWQRYIES